MEPVTHALASVALGRAGLNRLARPATPMLLVSGLIADADWLSYFGGARAFLHGHRTATHSLLGTALLAVLVTAVFFLFARTYPGWAFKLVPGLAVCAAGAGGHLLLDLLNGYGVQLLWPLDGKWYAWDLAAQVDPWILFFLLAGLLVPALLRLVLEEIGAESKRRGPRRGAVAGLALVALFCAGRLAAHQRAVALLDSRQYRGQVPLAVAAFPMPSNPLLWAGVVETDNALVNVEVPVGLGLEFDPDRGTVRYKPEESAVLASAVNSGDAADFLRFARFPLARVAAREDGYRVRLRDMRFAAGVSGRRGIVAVIDLNAQQQVVGERLEFGAGEN